VALEREEAPSFTRGPPLGRRARLSGRKERTTRASLNTRGVLASAFLVANCDPLDVIVGGGVAAHDREFHGRDPINGFRMSDLIALELIVWCNDNGRYVVKRVRERDRRRRLGFQMLAMLNFHVCIP
jgi:hypothetical protein